MSTDNRYGGRGREDRFTLAWGLRGCSVGRRASGYSLTRILMRSLILGCTGFTPSCHHHLVNNARRGEFPLYLGSRDFAQVPWRQNLPSFISLINLFFSKFMTGGMEGYSLAIMAAVLLTKRGIEREFLTAETDGGIMLL